MTRSCTCGVSASTWRRPASDLKCVYTTDVSHWMAANRLKLNADKTELLWAGSKYGSTLLGSSGPPLRLGDETVTASDHVRLLGITISSDLSPVKHVHVGTISSSCFYWLCQIRRIRRSLDAESAKTLVHAFITSRIDGCNTVLAGSPRTITDKLQRLLNAAARVVSNTGKFDRGLTHLLHSKLHGSTLLGSSGPMFRSESSISS